MILARSPYIVEINETPQESTRIELFIWNGTGAAPAAPSYSLSKKVPSINNNATFYNLSPFIREYFNFIYSTPYAATNNVALNQYAYCNVTFKTYYTLDGVETLLDTVETFAVDGYGYYEEKFNPDLSYALLTLRNANVFTYLCDGEDSEELNAGTITILGTNFYPALASRVYVVYTSLTGAGSPIEVDITEENLVNIWRVHPDFYAEGNKLEIKFVFGPITSTTYTAYFQPQCECKYEAFGVDFINKHGAWQRETFYKASTETLEMENTKFKLNPVPFPDYNTQQGQYKTFNTNGKKVVKLNTGWVEESFKDTIQEMLLSEVVRINGLPAMLRTKSVEKFKSINTKNINYQIEFEMSYDVINSIS